MYKPKFNQVLVEIDLGGSKWGNSNEEMMGPSYREGKVIDVCDKLVRTDNYPWITKEQADEIASDIASFKGKQVMWNEGHEAGKTFEDGDKLYALINWWDIVGVKEIE